MNETYLAPKLKALSNPKRLRIYDMLMEGVQCNCEIAERLDFSLSLISHHMRILEDAGLVKSERDVDDARWIYYSVDKEALSEFKEGLDQFLDLERIKPRVPSCGPQANCGTACDAEA
ncbi:MAG: metalloregulator ArsR/SmtB family transcription factor [Chloroflexota bacterium]|nr:metalloregulator ArsR/SmtB family transcription factor [Chloroflexota bacterium]